MLLEGVIRRCYWEVLLEGVILVLLEGVIGNWEVLLEGVIRWCY